MREFSRWIFLTGIFLAVYHIPKPTYGQEVENQDVLHILSKKAFEESKVMFADPVWFKAVRAPVNYEDLSLSQLLRKVLPGLGLTYLSFNPNYIVIVKDHRQLSYESEKPEEEEAADFYRELTYDPSKQYTVSGSIYDNKNSEPVIGATLYIQELESGTITNEFGEFSITIPSALYHMDIKAVGFDLEEIVLPLVHDTTLQITMYDKTTQLEEIIVYDESEDHNVTDISMGTDRLNIETLKRIPPLMGQVDVIRSIMLLPGITTVGEGATGFNVRGGSIDQNLILLDEAPIYNSAHLFGFFTAFNSAAIKDVTISKGGIPSQYGGRISSILDVKIKQGNQNKFSGRGGIGLITSDLLLEGPIIRDKTTFVVSGRYSYTDWYLRYLPDNYLKNSNAQFSDLILKITHKVNKNNTISITGYNSHDAFKFPGDTIYGWSNRAATFKWYSSLNPRLYMINSAVYSNYRYDVNGNQPENAFIWDAGIDYYSFKSEFNFLPDLKNKIDYGLHANYRKINMGNLIPDHEYSNINPLTLEEEQGVEASAYYNHELRLNSKFTIMGGVRYSYFAQLGPGSQHLYDPDKPRSRSSITETLYYKQNEVMTHYAGFEPRISMRYGLGRSTSVKASYNRMRQYIHLVSNTTAVTPVDIWKLSDTHLHPQIGDQISMGVFRNFKANTYETSIELYYKKVKHSIDYKDGANLILNDDLETELIDGEIRTIGAEFLVKKNKGRLNGWISYTLSNSQRKVEGRFKEETINGGEYYPVNYDKLHDLAVVVNYDFTRRHHFGLTYIYYSGRPITYPTGSYGYYGFLIANFEKRNQIRIPHYSRIDISLTIDGNHKKDKKWHGSWTFSIYNLLGRKNPYSIFFKSRYFKVPQAYRLSVIGTIVPSVTYNFRF